jgi:hypothetical protein
MGLLATILYPEIARRAEAGQSLRGFSANAFERVLEGEVNPDQTATPELHVCLLVTHSRRDPLDLPDKDCIGPGKE